MISLPSLHALDTAQSMRIWLAAEAIDMRRGFDRLAEHARTVIRLAIICSSFARVAATG
jgi:transposase